MVRWMRRLTEYNKGDFANHEDINASSDIFVTGGLFAFARAGRCVVELWHDVKADRYVVTGTYWSDDHEVLQ